MEEKKRQGRYDKEFKENAVRLVVDGRRKVSDVARDLGISTNIIYRWRRQYLEDPQDCFPGKGHLKPHEEEIMRLKRELADVKMDRDILKKATAFFSRHTR